MQIFVTGMDSIRNFPFKTIVINQLEESDTIRSLELIIINKYKLENLQFYFVYGGKMLNSNKKLGDYYIHKESTLSIIFRVKFKQVEITNKVKSSSCVNSIEI